MVFSHKTAIEVHRWQPRLSLGVRLEHTDAQEVWLKRAGTIDLSEYTSLLPIYSPVSGVKLRKGLPDSASRVKREAALLNRAAFVQIEINVAPAIRMGIIVHVARERAPESTRS